MGQKIRNTAFSILATEVNGKMSLEVLGGPIGDLF
jgi:hypothetical protein